VDPGVMTTRALLNCLIREVAEPERQVADDGDYVRIRLPRSGRLLRARLRRPSAGIGPRLTGEAEELAPSTAASWRPVGWNELAEMMAAELTLATGVQNTEFAGQVRDSHTAMTAVSDRRPAAPASVPASAPASEAEPWLARYIASEQSLAAGHPFHPAPKSGPADSGQWLHYAPEAGARFPLHFLAVREEAVAQAGDLSALDGLGGPQAPPGYVVLPAHPWQFRMLSSDDWTRRALRDRLLLDLGPGGTPVAATSSVRTVYDPVADLFCKFSLAVRITNCVRTSAWYELDASVLLTGLLTPLFASFPGDAVLLGEPGYRTVAATSRRCYEGLSVLVRQGLGSCLEGELVPLLAGAVAEHGVGTDDPAGWWRAYLVATVPPVLTAFFAHGVVLEPHLQNVVICVDREGMPVRGVFRDLEGTKLTTSRHQRLLASLPPAAATRLGYDEERGWNRVAYCLFVNHLDQIAAALADGRPAIERELWDVAREVVTDCARDLGWPPRLRALIAGVPLPAKANLRTRWARAADREAGYIPVRNPLGRW
jgi:siderophore synthetase component